MKKIDWSRLVPLGIDGRKVKNGMMLALGLSAVFSLRFIADYSFASNNLYAMGGTDRVLMPGAQMIWFSDLLNGVFFLFGLTALCMPIVALIFYLYHYQGSKSIYTMRRLPNKKELLRRCLFLPVCCAAACLLLSVLLLLLYYETYMVVFLKYL